MRFPDLPSIARRTLNHRLTNLDLLRGLAALFVCASHLRAFLFVDFQQVSSPGILDRLFYLGTGLGHQAVVVFFVLSGYLVGGSILTAYQLSRWSWGNYALRRMTRLWVVLLPALVLTVIIDSWGRHWQPAGYEGAMHSLFDSGPSSAVPADLRATTFLGNALFLQTITVNCFGTNGPLWSLANEFWYYVLFPLICGVVIGRGLLARIVSSLLVVGLVWWLPSSLVWSGLIWLFGVGAFWLGRFESVRRVCRNPVWFIGTGVLALSTLAATKSNSVFGTDWSVGIAFAVWTVGLVSWEHPVDWLKKLGSGLSEMSYTLYLIHFPLLAFVFFCFFKGRQFSPGPTTYLLYGALLSGSVAFAAATWWCFERNTDRFRNKLEALILRYGLGALVNKKSPA